MREQIMMQITANKEIWLDGQKTELSVTQWQEGTRVYSQKTGALHPMPANRYALSHDAPDSGVPGLGDFERDICALLARQ